MFTKFCYEKLANFNLVFSLLLYTKFLKKNLSIFFRKIIKNAEFANHLRELALTFITKKFRHFQNKIASRVKILHPKLLTTNKIKNIYLITERFWMTST